MMELAEAEQMAITDRDGCLGKSKVIKSWLLWLAYFIVTSIAILGILVGLAYIQYGSVGTALAVLRNEPLALQPDILEIGQTFSGERHSEILTIKNFGNSACTIIGYKSDCGCAVLSNDCLPAQILAGEDIQIEVNVRIPSTDVPTFRKKVLFYTDTENQPFLVLPIVGIVSIESR